MSLLILYYAVHKNHPKEIELCGLFKDIKYFHSFMINEEVMRGWKTKRYQILKDGDKKVDSPIVYCIKKDNI